MSQPQPSSNKKNKQKKSQQVQQLQNIIAQLKRQNLQYSLQLQKLTDKTLQLKHYQAIKQTTYEKDVKQLSNKIQQLQLVKMAQNQRINIIRQQREQYQIQNGCLKYRIQKLLKESDDLKQYQKYQLQEMKKQKQYEIMKYQTIVNQYQTSINQRLQYLQVNCKLEDELKNIQADHKRTIADKDRDKLQTIDFLKKEMFQKSKQMRMNLLTMRRQQMATNTRLTVLQNHQLMEELQYQSKNTDKILKKNQQLQKKFKQLTKELQLQKQIQQELAKRSTISKKILKNLNLKNITLEKQLQDQCQNKKYSTTNNNNLSRSSQNQSTTISPNISTSQALSQCLKTISILQNELHSYRNQITKLQKQKQHFKQLYTQNQPKFQYYLKIQNDLRTIMIRFLFDTLEGNVIGQENSVEYDISRLKNKHIEEWSKSDIEITVKMLLTFIKPHFTMKNLKTEFIKNHNQSDQKNVKMLLEQSSNIIQPQSHLSYMKRLKHSKIKSLSTTILHSRTNQLEKSHNNVDNKDKDKKQFTLVNVFKDYKDSNNRNKTKEKIKKSQSQHLLSVGGQKSTNLSSADNQKSCKKLKQNVSIHEFVPQNFRNKDAKKLLRTSVRQWGKKVQFNPKSSIIG